MHPFRLHEALNTKKKNRNGVSCTLSELSGVSVYSAHWDFSLLGPTNQKRPSTLGTQMPRRAAYCRRAGCGERLLRGAPATTGVLAAEVAVEVPFNSWPWSARPVASPAMAARLGTQHRAHTRVGRVWGWAETVLAKKGGTHAQDTDRGAGRGRVVYCENSVSCSERAQARADGMRPHCKCEQLACVSVIQRKNTCPS